MSMYRNMADYYEYIFPVEKKADFLNDVFKGFNQLLDVGAADGRVAKSLVEKGFRVSGVDLSEDMVRVSKKVAEGEKNLDISLMDMTEIDKHFDKESFDGIYCIGNTLVHLNSYKTIEETIKKMKSLLKKDGKLVIQVLNYDFVYKNNVTELPIIENEKIKFVRTYKLAKDSVTFETTLLVKDTGEEFNESNELYPIRKEQLESALKNAGFVSLEYFGGFNGKSFSKDSMPLIVVAK